MFTMFSVYEISSGFRIYISQNSRFITDITALKTSLVYFERLSRKRYEKIRGKWYSLLRVCFPRRVLRDYPRKIPANWIFSIESRTASLRAFCLLSAFLSFAPPIFFIFLFFLQKYYISFSIFYLTFFNVSIYKLFKIHREKRLNESIDRSLGKISFFNLQTFFF